FAEDQLARHYHLIVPFLIPLKAGCVDEPGVSTFLPSEHPGRRSANTQEPCYALSMEEQVRSIEPAAGWPSVDMVDVPTGPYALRGCQSNLMAVEFGPEVLALVAPELTPSRGPTGGFYIFAAPHGSALAPLTKLSCWIDVEGYSGSPGTTGR